jgi:hypothetical protein
MAIDQTFSEIVRQRVELHQLFHHVDDVVLLGRGLRPVVVVEPGEGPGDGRLIGDCDQVHSAADNANLVDVRFF